VGQERFLTRKQIKEIQKSKRGFTKKNLLSLNKEIKNATNPTKIVLNNFMSSSTKLILNWNKNGSYLNHNIFF
jgi:hypothetical protein